MEQPNFGKKDSGDTAIYTDSLSQINVDRAEYLRKIDTLRAQGKTEDDLEIQGYRFNLKELKDQEDEIRKNMN